ncbi:MAG: c-type cytochrome domain-containing protein [Ekhidna sp.]|uniref:c-type cytochrome domain-containing protein n=1 Tax=Ekhidna sp. TaxID=2608089 RepID=UPI0032EB91E4
MKNLAKIISVVFIALVLESCDDDKVEAGDPVVKDNVSFALDIQPILTAECATCHNPTEVEPDFREGLAYASIEELIDEGDVIPGNAEESELVEMLEFRSEDGNSMPPAGPLTPTEIALIKKWIDEGVKDN